MNFDIFIKLLICMYGICVIVVVNFKNLIHGYCSFLVCFIDSFPMKSRHFMLRDAITFAIRIAQLNVREVFI